jgi:sigma-E factor negative regulatory protein RseB
LLGALPTPGARLEAFYELAAHKGKKLLGRNVQVVDIRARDGFRYGYRLWLDEETAMPLRSVVIDGSGRPIEQILFTRLEVRDTIPDREIEPTVDATGFQWIRTGRRLASQQSPDAAWHPLRIPPGFRLVASRLQLMPGSPVPAHHLIFSDGMAAISIFIEPGPATGPAPAESSSMGSANSYSTSIQGHVVTAVGEVPPETVRDVANSVVPLHGLQPAPALRR